MLTQGNHKVGWRLAWLSASEDDVSPSSASLAFRVRGLRGRQATRLNGVRVCPAEDGVSRGERVACERCGLCWQALPDPSTRRVRLPLLREDGSPPEEEGR